jgi:hypothetical protein
MYPKPQYRNEPRRHRGPTDPSEDVEQPSLSLLDEAIGTYKGTAKFTHADGDDKFHMLSVRTSVKDIGMKDSREMHDQWKGDEDESD